MLGTSDIAGVASHSGLVRAVFFAVALALVIVFTLNLRQSAQRIANQAQRVTLVEEAPRPPPKREEPPLPKPTEPVEIEPAEPVDSIDDEPPPVDDTLGVDADAEVGGPDGFGLAAKKGGTDIVKLAHIEGSSHGRGNGRGKPEWVSYTSALRIRLERTLSRHDDLRSRNYDVSLRVWVDDNGSVQRCELDTSSGDASVDSLIARAVTSAQNVGAPPSDMPKLLRFRLRSQGAG